MQQFGNDLTWAQGLIARLERDGHSVAATELASALRYPRHQMLSETVPVEKTVLVTIVVPRPDIVLPLLSWLKAMRHSKDDFRLAISGAEGARPDLVAFFKAASPLFSVTMEDASPLDYGVTTQLLDWYRKQVGGPMVDEIVARLPKSEHRRDWASYRLHMHCLEGGREKGCSQLSPMLGWVFRKSQKQVLSAIDRDKQGQFATWQIDLPERYDDTYGGIAFGLHPESEHELWKRRYRSLVSHGLQHGYGAIAMPHDLVNYKHDEEETPEGEYVRFVLRGGRKFH